MDFLVVVTPSHRQLYEEFFRRSLPADATVLAKTLDVPGDGAFLSAAWQRGVVGKLRWVLAYAESRPGAVFVLSDVDVQFFAGFRPERLRDELESSGVDILFQREIVRGPSREANTGFYVARATPYLLDLLRRAIRLCEDSKTQNDQTAVNTLLVPGDFGCRWGLLPPVYYARSQGFPPPRGIVLHHANVTYTVPQKVAQLRRVRKLAAGGRAGRWLAIAAEAADYAVSGRLGGMLWRRMHRRLA